MKSISSREMCWRVVSSLGRKQISVQIILHNSEFLLPGHVVSGRLSSGASGVFKLNKLSGGLKLNITGVTAESSQVISYYYGWILRFLLNPNLWDFICHLTSFGLVGLSNSLCLFTSSLGCPATPLNIRLVELLENLIIIIVGSTTTTTINTKHYYIILHSPPIFFSIFFSKK